MSLAILPHFKDIGADGHTNCISNALIRVDFWYEHPPSFFVGFLTENILSGRNLSRGKSSVLLDIFHDFYILISGWCSSTVEQRIRNAQVSGSNPLTSFSFIMKEIRKLLGYLGRYKWRVLPGLLFLTVVDGAQLVIPRVIRRAVDEIASGTFTHSLGFYGCLIALIGFLIAFFRFWWRFFIFGTARRIERDIRQELYDHLLTLDPPFYAKKKTGDIMAHATNDLDAVRMTLGIGVVILTDTVVLISGTLVMMILISPSLTLLSLIPLPALALVTLYFDRLIHRRFKLSQESFSRLTERVRELVAGIRVIKNFSQEKGALGYFNLANRDYFKKYLALVKVWGVFEPLLIFLASMTITTVLYFGGVRTITGSITLGEFIAFISYLAILIWPIIGLGWVVNVIEQGKTSMGRIMKLMEEKPRIKDTGKIREIKGVIEFRNVNFSYNGRKVLEDINLVFEPGKFTAIVGRTGSGKTTIINLLLRFYEASGIFVDGNPIEDISLYALRKAVGWVPQETFLFSDTIRNNIAFGKPDASLEEIERVAKLAGIYDEIMSFPGGFDTVLGERGVNLSGGQRQRIAIARALLLAPPVFILDDALSSVDSHTEVKIMENIREFLKERTSIVISHRLSAIQDADEIVVMDRGRIVERGTHSELIRKDGLYREMYEKQKLRELLE